MPGSLGRKHASRSVLKARGLSSSPWWEHKITLNLVLERRMRNGVCWDEMASTQGSRLKQQLLGGRKRMVQEGPQGRLSTEAGAGEVSLG